MEKLKLESTLSKGKYSGKKVSEIVNVKGEIFSMIKDGYDFDDEVLSASHIKKNVRNVMTFNSVYGKFSENKERKLVIDTASMKQILSELNTLDSPNYGDNDSVSKNEFYCGECEEININNYTDED